MNFYSSVDLCDPLYTKIKIYSKENEVQSPSKSGYMYLTISSPVLIFLTAAYYVSYQTPEHS